MQASREPTRQKRSTKRRSSRKKSLSPSDLKRARDEPKQELKANGKRSLSEGSVKSKHRKSNIRRTLTHPLAYDDDVDIDIKSDKVPVVIPTVPTESDESNLPPTSSDRDTEDDQRVPNLTPVRPRWDSGSEIDSIVSIVKRASARRRRTPSNQELALSSEPGEASGTETARMRPDDYRLVFLSSDSSREDDSSSTTSSVHPPNHDDCDWDYFEPGAPPIPLPPPPPPPVCQRACSCGAEPRIVAVPVPVPVPVPAGIWPAVWPPAPHWHTYPGFPPLDAASLARLTAQMTGDKSVFPPPPHGFTDLSVEARRSRPLTVGDKPDDKITPPVDRDPPDGAIADDMPEHLHAERSFTSSEESCSSNDENDGARRSYDLTSGAPEEPATTDEDSDDSGGGGGQFSRVFVVNPADSSSEIEDDAESSGIDCDDSSDRKSDNLDAVAAEVALQNEACELKNEESDALADTDSSVMLVESNEMNETFVISCESAENSDIKSNFMKFCDENMLYSEMCENYNSFKASNAEESDNVDSCMRSRTSSGNYECDSLDPIPSSREGEASDPIPSSREGETSNPIFNVRESELSSEDENKKEISLRSELSPEKIDLFKGIERTLSELLKQESSDEGAGTGERGRCADAAPVSPVSRARPSRPDVARFTSRVMITHDDTVLAPDTQVTVSHAQPQPDVTVVSNADTLSAVVCLEEGLADDDSWVEDVSHDSDPTDSDSEDEASLSPRAQELAYCRRSIDFTLHTIVEESCEESETENAPRKKARPISATELEKYFFFGLGEGRNFRDDEDQVSDTSSVCSEGGESIVDNEQPERTGVDDDLVSSRLEKYFLSGLMGFSQERNDSDGSGSVGSDSEGKHSPEHRRKRLVRARGTPRSHSSSLDNLIGDEASQDNQEASDGSSTETEDRVDSTERLDAQGENKRKKQGKKTRGSPADEKRLSTEFAEEARDETRSVSEGEDGKATPRPEFPPLGTELSEAKKQTSRDSGFVGSCDDLLRNGDSNSDYSRSHEPKIELEEIIEENRPDIEERIETVPASRPPPTPLVRKDSFNNWSSDEETNLMMTKMRQFFKQMINSNVRASTPAASAAESSKPPKPPQLVYFENELTRLMKTVPGIRDEEVREIVEYLSSEDTWSDSYDSSDYAGSDLEGTTVTRLALRKQISDSCREIIDEFDRGNSNAGSLERDAAGAYRKLAETLGRAGEGSPPLFGKVMRHIGGRLVALMHEVSAGASASTDDDSASEPGALARSRSHDILEATASRGSVASDCERFSWRGSFESALLAADSRGTLEARRSPAELGHGSHSRSCGAIGGSEDRLWRGRRRASAPDAEPEEEQRSGSLPRLPSVAGNTTVPTGPVKSARYRAPGFRTATRAASAPGLHAPRRRRPPHTSHFPPPAAPASAPSLQDEVYSSEALSPGHATLPRPTKSPMLHDRDNDSDRLSSSKSSLQIGRSESMASVYSGAGEGTRSSVTVRGEVQFSLLYNYRLGALEVGVKRCRDLAPVDVKKNRSDPYVKVYLLPDKSKAGKRKTKVKKNTLNPVWEETLSFVQPLASLSARTLWLSVWHADMFGRNDFLGEVTLPLHDVVFDDPQPAWYKLTERTEQFDEQQDSRGDLIIGLKFDISERGKGTLHVLVKEAKGLIAAKPNGLADVFCKGYLLPDRGRLVKQKTSVVRRTLNPKWEHTFVYRGLTLQDLSHRALELSLWDRDRLASNDFMGAVRLSLGSGTYMGASVNWMDSVGKEVTLWQTMMQRPNFWVEGSLPLRSHLSN